MRPKSDPYSTFQITLSTVASSCNWRISSLDEDTKVNAHYVESPTPDFLAAINKRNFDIETNVYRHKSPDFVAEGGFLFPNTLNLEDYMGGRVTIVAEHPRMHCNLLDWTTHVDLKAGFAQVFCNMKIAGRPSGLVRRSVIILECMCKREENGKKESGRKDD